MDFVSLGFLFLIVLGGGASAWLADWLGWRIGKKRHSLFGMRPKHFARLVVTIAGALIPLVAIALLAGSFEGVRVWILRGREAAQQLPGVARQLNQAQTDLRSVQQKAGEVRRENSRVTRELAGKNKQLDDQTRLLNDQSHQIADQVVRIARLGPRLARLTAEARRSAAETRRLRVANSRVQLALNRTQSAFDRRQTDLELSQSQLRSIQAETKVANATLQNVKNAANEVNRENLRLTILNKELSDSIANLRTSITNLQGEIERLRSAQDEAERDTETARTERDALRDEVARLDRDRRRAEQLFNNDSRQTRYAPLTFRSGDELARVVVPDGASVADTGAFIESVLRNARMEAERRGARPNPNVQPPMRAADLIEGQLDGKPISPTEQVNRLTTALAGGSADTVVVARSIFNLFADEAVALELRAYPDPLVFRSGEVVAEGRLDSRRGDEAVYVQLNEFLTNVVQGRAKDAKMIPLRSGGEESFGQVEPAQVLRVIRTVGAEERVYRIQAIAVGDIRAGDRLKVELRLR